MNKHQRTIARIIIKNVFLMYEGEPIELFLDDIDLAIEHVMGPGDHPISEKVMLDEVDESSKRMTQIECAIRNAIPEGSYIGETVAVLGKLITDLSLASLRRMHNVEQASSTNKA
jgi:hypothetical protein